MQLIEIGKAVIMGIVEGATEFIPVSSTGHLILAGEWLNFLDAARRETFEVFIQLGAILAIVWIYRSKILHTFGGWQRPAERRLLINLLIAFLPAALIGFVIHDWIKAALFKPVVVASALVIGGVVILVIESMVKRHDIATVDDIPNSRALGVGLAQVLALIPGVSRSGATIMGGVSLGLSRVAATEFSFFLAIPIMFAATLFDLFKARDVLSAADAPVFATGFIVSFITAVIVVKKFLQFVSSHTFRPFAWYRIAFGLALLAFYLSR
ncbi:MAG: undecaprenyl-diphosphate phosphatase [Longimicrobiales bacterium]